jgi:hypothetical protein
MKTNGSNGSHGTNGSNGSNGTNGSNGSAPRWFLVVRPEQLELYEILRERLHGSGVEVVVDRRRRERRRGSLGPAMDRRVTERRRQRPIAHMAVASPPGDALSHATREAERLEAARALDDAFAQRCPTCAEAVELEMPRFPHPPARVEMEVDHLAGNGRDGRHYVEIAAFTVSGRLILSQRVPARRSHR